MTPIATTTKDVRLISAPETAFILRQALGPFKAWEDWLSDVRRGKAGACSGPILEPYCKLKDPEFGCFRPMYAVQDIKAFILQFRSANPASCVGIKPTVYIAEIDAGDMRHWKARKLVIIKPAATWSSIMSTMKRPCPAVMLAP